MKADIKEQWTSLTQWIQREGVTQERLAKVVGVSQAAVSRVLRRCPEREGRAFRKLCSYALENAPPALDLAEETRPIVDQTLAAALWEVWNGTPEHARALAAMIRAVGAVATVGAHN